MIVKLPTEHHLEFLILKGGCRGSSESTLVKMSNCWKSNAAANVMQKVRNSDISLKYNPTSHDKLVYKYGVAGAN